MWVSKSLATTLKLLLVALTVAKAPPANAPLKVLPSRRTKRYSAPIVHLANAAHSTPAPTVQPQLVELSEPAVLPAVTPLISYCWDQDRLTSATAPPPVT